MAIASRKMARLKRLPRAEALVLEGLRRQIGIEIAEGAPYHPHACIWVDVGTQAIRALNVLRPDDPPDAMLDALVTACLEPPDGLAPALPKQVEICDPALLTLLGEALAPLGIPVEWRPRLVVADQVIDKLESFLMAAGSPGGPPKLSDWAIPEALMRRLFTAAAGLARREPWAYAQEYPPIAVEVKRHGVDTLYACVLGGGGEVYGLACYFAMEPIKQMRLAGQAGATGPVPGGGPATAFGGPPAEVFHDSLVVFMMEDEEVGPEYVEEVKARKLPIAYGAYPTFLRTFADQSFRLPDEAEAAVLALTVEGINRFVSRHQKRIAEQDWPVTARTTIGTGDEAVPLALSMPPPGEPAEFPPASRTVYRFKVELEWEPAVWRRIEIRDDQTLVDLHQAIQSAFGWDDDHLWAFYLSGKAWDQSTEYGTPGYTDARDADVRLSQLGLRARKKLLYLFDFGDQLRHRLTLEKIMKDAADTDPYPRSVESHGNAPPQYPYAEEWDDEDEDEADEGAARE